MMTTSSPREIAAVAEAERYAALNLALQRQQSELNVLFNLMPALIWIKDTNNRILRVNQRVADLAGKPIEEIEGRPSSEIYPAHADQFYADDLKVINSGVPRLGIVERMANAGGKTRWVLTDKVPVLDPAGEVIGIVVMSRDITEQKAAEDELRASNEKFHQLADNITDVFWIRSADMREVLYVSPGFETIWGRPVASLVRDPHKWSEFILPEDRDRVLSSFSALTDDAPTLDVEYRIVRPNDEIRWVRTRGFRVRDGDGKVIRNIGIVTDITEKRRQAEELETERSRLVAAQRVAKVGSWETDLVTMSVKWSEETHRIFESDPLTSNTTHAFFLSSVHPEDRARVEEALTGSLNQHTPSSVEHRLLMPDGRIKFVEERWQVVFDGQNHPIRAIGTCQDITTRRESDDALRQSQKRMRDVFDGLGPSMFVALLTPEGILVEINRSPLAAAGLKPEDVLGRRFGDTEWWAHSPDVQRQLHEAIERAARGESSRYDVRNLAGDKVIDLDFSLEPLRDESGKVVFLIASAIVITDRKIAEGALRQAQKMEAVGQLAAGVAHEFNNLLQALMSMSAILQLQSRTPEVTKIGSDMESLIKRGAGLTQQLLLFSRDRAITRADVDLGSQMQKACDFLRQLIPETIAIAVEISSERLNVEGDAGQIQQVLLNLAINARDAMLEGGTLTLRTGRVGNEVFVEVEDTGHGMDEVVRRHLFEPFFSTKETGKGTGLGLAVAHGIVKQHGGRIEVESRPGEGSRFRIVLPELLRAGARSPEPIADGSMPKGGGRVLLVEDDPSVRSGISTLLELIGYEVIVAGSGEEAIDMHIDPPPALLLTDNTLPGMPGIEVAHRLRTRWPSLQIVLMSGYFNETLLPHASQQGWHFLQKPFELTDLASRLETALAG